MRLEEIFDLSCAKFDYMKNIRRRLHRNPGIGFDNEFAIEEVQKELSKLGISSERCGKCGVTAVIGEGERCFLLRADTDGLPTFEGAKLDFKSENGNMHGCGHDMHTAMLLGAAAILKEHESELCGTVRLMFQSAEETLEGARDMIESGVLKNPTPDAAMMIHVMTGTALKCGMITVSPSGVSAPAADFFEIVVVGKGCHGSSPVEGIDPIFAAAQIVTALSEPLARELAFSENAVLTIGAFNAGSAANVIPDRALLKGTLRCFDEELRERLKARICEISVGIAAAYRAEAEVTFTSGCPALVNDGRLCEMSLSAMKKVFGKEGVISASDMPKNPKSTKTAGSEDFAYVSRKVPSVMLAVAAGETEKGFGFPLHHPMAVFDEQALVYGCAAFCANTIEFFNMGEF